MKERIISPCLQLTHSLVASTRQSDHSTAAAKKALCYLPFGVAQKAKSTMYLLIRSLSIHLLNSISHLHHNSIHWRPGSGT